MPRGFTAPGTNTTYTANFITSYLLTTQTSAGGTAGPSTGYFAAGSTVPLTAAANSGFVFTGWTGKGPGSYTGTKPAGTATLKRPIMGVAHIHALCPVPV